ncbi:MAG: thermonuclease family protein [Verrucomicrobiales bacterium]
MSDPASSRTKTSAKPVRLQLMLRYLVIGALVAGAVWLEVHDKSGAPQIQERETPGFHPPQESGSATARPAAPDRSAPKPAPASPPKHVEPASPGVQASSTKVNGFEKLEGCRIEPHKNNDGDSFMVRHGNRVFELRLYFVDTAEKYLSDRYADQRDRVAKQAKDFGGLSLEQTVALGLEAKSHTMSLLEGKAFTVYTKWERVYNGDRYYGFVVLPGSEEYLSEELVEHGLGRIHTKGEASPDGLSSRQFEANLRALEREAKSKHLGAWGAGRP